MGKIMRGQRIGILTAGGDCPGINAAIRGVGKTAHLLSQDGLNVVGIPKTTDNDVWGTDLTFGFDSGPRTTCLSTNRKK
jgi:6-phosphofructokinase